MKIVIAILLVICLSGLSGCKNNLRTAAQVQDAYYICKAHDPSFDGLLYYRGTDSEYHYFVYPSTTELVLIKIKKEEIYLPDIRPPISNPDLSICYYSVDPIYGFKRVDSNK